jgi:cysteinyl-tRNA synthetase
MARQNKDFAEGDRIRDELLALGVALRDAPEGTEWTIEQ